MNGEGVSGPNSLVWTIEYTRTALNQLKNLDKQAASRILAYLDQRAADGPRQAGKALKGPLGAFWRYRVGDYRVICEIEDGALRILVVQVGHRREVYRQ